MNGAVSSLSTTASEDESFVVLGRSILPDEQPKDDGPSINVSTPPLSSFKSTSSNYLPKMPQMSQSQLMMTSRMSSSAFTSTSELSPDEIQTKLNAVLQENMYLKEVLNQNNLALKEQFEKLEKWQEEVMQVHTSHKEKFDETKQFIANLRLENANLKKKISSYEALEVENAALKNKLELLDSKKVESPDSSEGKWNELVDQLSHQLSLVERARREELLNNQREQENMRSENTSLKEQLLAAQMKLTEFVSKKESLKSFHSAPVIEDLKNLKKEDLAENAKIYEEHVRNLKRFFDSQKQRQIQLQNCLESALNVLSKEESQKAVEGLLNRLKKELDTESDKKMMEKFVSAQNHFHKIFFDYQMLQKEVANTQEELDNALTELNTKNKQITSLKKDLAASKAEVSELIKLNDELTEQIRILKKELSLKQSAPKVDAQEIAKLTEKISVLNNEITIKDEALQYKDDEIAKMQTKIQDLQLENESIQILRAQVELYQSDFNTERQLRVSLQEEKNRIAEDLRLLQRRNQQLIEQLENQLGTSAGVQAGISSRSPSVGTPSSAATSNVPQYICPSCHFSFRTYENLAAHVNICLDAHEMGEMCP